MAQLMTLFWKFFRFGAVGVSGMIVDFGLTYLFKEIFKANKYVANSIGFIVAATSNYVLNRVWTFNSTNPEIGVEYLKFVVVSTIGLGINTLILWYFNQKKGYNFYVAKLIAIAVTLIWNFFVNLLYTFAV